MVAAPSLVHDKSITAIDDLHQLPWLAFRTYYREQGTSSHLSDGSERRFEILPRMSTDSLYAWRNTAVAIGCGGRAVLVSSRRYTAASLSAVNTRIVCATIAGLSSFSPCAVLPSAAATIYRYDT